MPTSNNNTTHPCRPQPSPQSSVTSGISVGGSSVSTSAESTLTAASPKPPIVQTSDLSTSPSSASPPPNDRDNDHVFYNPCNSARAHSFFTNHSTDLYNSSNPSVNDSTLDDSHDIQDTFYTNNYAGQKKQLNTEIKNIYSNIDPLTQHSTNILIRYHDSDRQSITPAPNIPPKPTPRSSVISSVLSNDSSTHIVQSYGPAYANTYFSKNLSTVPRPPSNHNDVGVPIASNSISQYGVLINEASSNTLGMQMPNLSISGKSSLISADISRCSNQSSISNDNSRYSSSQTITSNRNTALRQNGNDDLYNCKPYQSQSSVNNNTFGGDGRSESRLSTAGSQQILQQQTNWDANRSGRPWTNSLGRPTARPSQSRQVSRHSRCYEHQ